jgi:small subunit ribosomal protein S8
MSEIDMVSTPGRRVYKAVDSIPKAKGGLGIYILSTSKGVMSDFDARNQNIGGELLCKIC